MTRPVLVVGFSVVAEKSLVEIVQDRYLETGGARVAKVGLGGWFPFLLKYVIEGILDDHPGSHVILEVSTSSLRSQPRPPEDHEECMTEILAACARRGMPVSILDLPRTDIDNEKDWLFDLHAELAVRHGLGYRRVPLSEGLLRDVVHPTEPGKAVYADALEALIVAQPDPSALVASLADRPSRFYAIPASRCLRGGKGSTRSFSRSGFTTEIVAIPENVQVAFDLPPGTILCGYSMLVGPETGYLTFKCNGMEKKATCYDAFAYYERLSANFFGTHRSDWAVLYQHRGRPNIDLAKGVASDAPRTGYIGHFFAQR